jgi:hypothetical protein
MQTIKWEILKLFKKEHVDRRSLEKWTRKMSVIKKNEKSA